MRMKAEEWYPEWGREGQEQVVTGMSKATEQREAGWVKSNGLFPKCTKNGDPHKGWRGRFGVPVKTGFECTLRNPVPMP